MNWIYTSLIVYAMSAFIVHLVGVFLTESSNDKEQKATFLFVAYFPVINTFMCFIAFISICVGAAVGVIKLVKKSSAEK